MGDDYRNTEYCPKLENIVKKKNAVVKMIKENHPRAIDMHSYISKNDEPYKLAFLKVYNCKCAYCGISLSIIDKESFEIDHFIYEKSEQFHGSKAAAGYIENLVPACHFCNHQKNSFQFQEEELKFFYPDAEDITNTFKRDELYYIKVSENFESNRTANEFYTQLKFGSEVRRIDYLLMSMIGLKDRISSDSEVHSKLGDIIELLRNKRNAMA